MLIFSFFLRSLVYTDDGTCNLLLQIINFYGTRIEHVSREAWMNVRTSIMLEKVTQTHAFVNICQCYGMNVRVKYTNICAYEIVKKKN